MKIILSTIEFERSYVFFSALIHKKFHHTWVRPRHLDSPLSRGTMEGMVCSYLFLKFDLKNSINNEECAILEVLTRVQRCEDFTQR